MLISKSQHMHLVRHGGQVQLALGLQCLDVGISGGLQAVHAHALPIVPRRDRDGGEGLQWMGVGVVDQVKTGVLGRKGSNKKFVSKKGCAS